MKSQIGRADLLECLRAHGPEKLEALASALGYEALPDAPVNIAYGRLVLPPIVGTGFSTTETPISAPQAQYLRVVSRRYLNPDDAPGEVPDWFRQAQAYSAEDPELYAPENARPPPQAPLVPWSRLWPFLKRTLGTRRLGHKPDIPRLVERVARGQTVTRVPRVARRAWAGECRLIFDFAPALTPFWADFHDLRRRLQSLRGQAGLSLVAFPEGDPGGRCWIGGPDGWREVPRYPALAPAAPLLILSDLGWHDATDARRRRWLSFGARLKAAGRRPPVLAPCPPRRWTPELAQAYRPVCWDRGIDSLSRRERAGAMAIESRGQSGERLLDLLSPAVRVEPALLRAARLLLPAGESDAGDEADAWNHANVHATLTAFYFGRAALASRRARFRDDSLRARVADAILRHHAHLSPAVVHEERWILAEALGQPMPPETLEFVSRAAKTQLDSAPGLRAEFAAWTRRMGGRQHAELWRDDRLAALWLSAHLDEWRRAGALTLPEGLSLERVGWLLDPVSRARRYVLSQRGASLIFQTDAPPAAESGRNAPGSPLTEIQAAAPWAEIEQAGERIARPLNVPIPVPAAARFRLRTDRETIEIEALAMPGWASDIGRDRYGLYADLTLGEVRQRFRWIAPGRFLMGSPPTEPEREPWGADETLHEVTLGQGFWLADTACTQALWIAVMGENPSQFRDDSRNPVETVSWNMAQTFVERLNEKIWELSVRLPTEAEWEYACRAGTRTPFSFGENITPEQVNYNGNYPYAGGRKGLYRQKTVPVQSLPPNPWGLHEMHGNVREWCQDWYGPYGAEAQTDPRGPDRGGGRVLRGGSWNGLGRYLRSARRGVGVPGSRSDDVGFRLALGPVEPAGTAGGQPPHAAGRTAARERGDRGTRDGEGGLIPRRSAFAGRPRL